jgi:hypothetical protein
MTRSLQDIHQGLQVGNELFSFITNGGLVVCARDTSRFFDHADSLDVGHLQLGNVSNDIELHKYFLNTHAWGAMLGGLYSSYAVKKLQTKNFEFSLDFLLTITDSHY